MVNITNEIIIVMKEVYKMPAIEGKVTDLFGSGKKKQVEAVQKVHKKMDKGKISKREGRKRIKELNKIKT